MVLSICTELINSKPCGLCKSVLLVNDWRNHGNESW